MIEVDAALVDEISDDREFAGVGRKLSVVEVVKAATLAKSRKTSLRRFAILATMVCKPTDE